MGVLLEIEEGKVQRLGIVALKKRLGNERALEGTGAMPPNTL
jgi:hypothetical protein